MLLLSTPPSITPVFHPRAADLVYLKLFKDIGQDDVDMLLPGSRVKFTW